MHMDAPEALYFPAGHKVDVPVVDPPAHSWPAAHTPLQAVAADPLLKVPAGHAVHSDAPAKLKCPGRHGSDVALLDPAGHA